ncbi:MAG: hypothetical protein FWC20_00930 [Oscillospiraceae bacterium]|nr:hypothetical protein [Oscillospiraceae bacterium]MCL2277957.1 hypothetical protein [Oscillospiraceae bacterium]
MKIELSELEFRRLLDMVYVGNWVLNSMRGLDRFADYDNVESRLFSYCSSHDMHSLVQYPEGVARPSSAFEHGGIHEAIADYEDSMFFEILAEELARRDMDFEPISPENFSELTNRIDEYIAEFEQNGIDNISLDR